MHSKKIRFPWIMIRFSVSLKLFIIISLFILFITPLFADSNHIFIGKEEKNRDITVSLMNDFRITLEGKGWYLNRYQRNSLAFRLRTIKTDRTVFLITPLREGTSYLLFSHLNDDVYVTVHVIAEGKTVPAPEKSTLTETPDTAGEGSDERRSLKSVLVLKKEEGAFSDMKNKEEYVKAAPSEKRENGSEDAGSMVRKKEGDVQKLSGEKKEDKTTFSKPRENSVGKKPLLKNKVYYIDKNKKAVEVPTRDENDLYDDAFKAINSGEYSVAIEKLNQYLSSCSACGHRFKVRMALAEIYSKRKEYDKAMQNLDVLAGAPEALQKDMYLKKAEIYSITGDLGNAALSYREAYETDKNDVKILEKLGDLYYRRGRYKDALDTYEEGIASGLMNDEILFRVASIYDRPGPRRNIERAYHYYKELIDTFESSQYREHSLKRVRFFEKNFYNYR